MRGLATVTMLAGIMWLAFWIPQIVFWGAKGTLPLLAFVGGLLAIAGSLAYLSQPGRSPEQARGSERETTHQRRNGHQPYYGRTWPATRTRPWQKRVP